MISEGALRLELVLDGGAVAQVKLSSTRRTDLSQLLVNRPLEEALRLLPSLFAVCGTAHTCAALEACEAALGVQLDSRQRDARRLLAGLETLDNQAFAFCLEWQQLAGRAPAPRELKALRAATEQLRRWAFDGPWARVGGGRIAARWSVGRLTRELARAVQSLVPDVALESPDALHHWLKSSAAAPGAALPSAVLAAGAEGFGFSTAPLLGELDARWFAQRIARPGFCAAPTLDGIAAEAGAIARASRHPAVIRELADHGRTLMTRLVARLADFSELGARLGRLAQSLRPASESAPSVRRSGVGTGVADTARGRLAHQVEIREGIISRWLTVAPTEWSFHPQGVVQEVFADAPAPDLQRNANWMVAALDPCVACTVQVVGIQDA